MDVSCYSAISTQNACGLEDILFIVSEGKGMLAVEPIETTSGLFPTQPVLFLGLPKGILVLDVFESSPSFLIANSNGVRRKDGVDEKGEVSESLFTYIGKKTKWESQRIQNIPFSVNSLVHVSFGSLHDREKTRVRIAAIMSAAGWTQTCDTASVVLLVGSPNTAMMIVYMGFPQGWDRIDREINGSEGTKC
ncbi:hypothetical protein CPB86DRAFT_801973 [Serendipita vermifera]|nr:hypothetical protein CPB86DRAFT_801973 [Serendipita vermifera]